MQYGLKKESMERIHVAIRKANNRIDECNKELKKVEAESMREFWIETLSKAELAYSCLCHIQESLMDFDFVLLNKEDYDLVSSYLM